ncbi:MAG: type II CAAX endopeptidase family protein [Bacteroidia bacterium]|nr:type II CAAX endopeptidase family protein [Bacteroidia bacterium]
MENHRFAIHLPDRGMKILRFPLIRFVIALVFFVAFTGLALGLASWIRKDLLPPESKLIGSAIQMILACTFAWAGYVLYCATVEGRRVYELDFRKGLRQTTCGILLGFGFISLIMLIMWLTGGYKVTGFNSVSTLWPFLIMAIQAGMVEEIMSRGIIFRIAEEGIGTWWSLLFSAFIFGFMHIWNPNATLFSSVSIALTAGVILAMLYVVTRQLWIPIGLHIGWNFTLGGIYGAPVSGGEPGGILAAHFTGPDWLTGGAFGPEASVITVIVFIVFGIYLIRKSIIDKSWIKPMWRNRK